MAQPDGADSGGDAIVDIEAGPRDCPVCTEPAVWVAVGPCGHGEVCVDCAVRLRFTERDWRCCICRAFCPTVVVTRHGGQRRQGATAAAFFPKPPLAAGGAGQVGRCLSYHSGMAAYFDDREQYERARKMCLDLALERSALSYRPAASQSQQDSPYFLVIMCVIYHVGITLIGCGGTGVPLALHLFPRWGYERILVVLACGFLFGAVAHSFWNPPGE